jgi:hypothetical protein
MNTDDAVRKSAESLKAREQTSTRLTLLAREFEFTLASIKRLERKAVAGRKRRHDLGSA